MRKSITISLRVVVTLVVVALALMALAHQFENYLKYPWTRDGQVRAQVVQVAPRVSGPIVELPIRDNQSVKQGDLLFKIDPRTFQAAVEQSAAALASARASEAEAKVEAQRSRTIYEKDSGAIAELQVIQKENAHDAAVASVAQAAANLETARLNLEFTEVRAPVDGFITNLRLRLGSQTVANQPSLALIDSQSFWVQGYFKETQIRRVSEGDPVVITLMGHPDKQIPGTVESLGWGIAQQNGSPGTDLLPNVNPTFDWIRLAQRIPVRVEIDEVPAGVDLRVGTTASVFIMTED